MNDLQEENEENMCMRISKKGEGKPVKDYEPEIHKGLFGISQDSFNERKNDNFDISIVHDNIFDNQYN